MNKAVADKMISLLELMTRLELLQMPAPYRKPCDFLDPLERIEVCGRVVDIYDPAAVIIWHMEKLQVDPFHRFVKEVVVETNGEEHSLSEFATDEDVCEEEED